MKITTIAGKKLGTKIATKVGTNVVGRFLGRIVPWVGLALTAKDFATYIAKPMSDANAVYEESNRRSGDWMANLPH